MRLNRFITAAMTSVAMVAAPAVAAPSSAATSIDSATRASTAVEGDGELFRGRRGRRGGALVFILIAVVIAIGVYIVIDDDNESPASP